MSRHYLGPGASTREGALCGVNGFDSPEPVFVDRPTYTTCRACLLLLPEETQQATWARTDRYFVLGIAQGRP